MLIGVSSLKRHADSHRQCLKWLGIAEYDGLSFHLESIICHVILVSGVWALGSELWALGSGLWALGSGLEALGSGLWALGSGQ